MSVASEIIRLQNDSAAIASAIAAKGVTVPLGSGYDDYASLIGQISGGGGGGGPHTLPSNYTRLEYIENPLNNSAYINLDLPINSTPGFDIDFMSYDEIGGTGYGCVIGARLSSGNNDFQLSSYTGNSYRGSLRLGTQTFDAHLPTKNTRFNAVLINAAYSVDGVSYTVSRVATNHTYSWYMFALNQQNGATQNGHGRLYSLKLYAGAHFIRDYVPCKSPDNVVGLYDLINESFWGPTTGTFTAGPAA